MSDVIELELAEGPGSSGGRTRELALLDNRHSLSKGIRKGVVFN